MDDHSRDEMMHQLSRTRDVEASHQRPLFSDQPDDEESDSMMPPPMPKSPVLMELDQTNAPALPPPPQISQPSSPPPSNPSKPSSPSKPSKPKPSSPSKSSKPKPSSPSKSSKSKPSSPSNVKRKENENKSPSSKKRQRPQRITEDEKNEKSVDKEVPDSSSSIKYNKRRKLDGERCDDQSENQSERKQLTGDQRVNDVIKDKSRLEQDYAPATRPNTGVGFYGGGGFLHQCSNCGHQSMVHCMFAPFVTPRLMFGEGTMNSFSTGPPLSNSSRLTEPSTAVAGLSLSSSESKSVVKMDIAEKVNEDAESDVESEPDKKSKKRGSSGRKRRDPNGSKRERELDCDKYRERIIQSLKTKTLKDKTKEEFTGWIITDFKLASKLQHLSHQERVAIQKTLDNDADCRRFGMIVNRLRDAHGTCYYGLLFKLTCAELGIYLGRFVTKSDESKKKVPDWELFQATEEDLKRQERDEVFFLGGPSGGSEGKIKLTDFRWFKSDDKTTTTDEASNKKVDAAVGAANTSGEPDDSKMEVNDQPTPPPAPRTPKKTGIMSSASKKASPSPASKKPLTIVPPVPTTDRTHSPSVAANEHSTKSNPTKNGHLGIPPPKSVTKNPVGIPILSKPSPSPPPPDVECQPLQPISSANRTSSSVALKDQIAQFGRRMDNNNNHRMFRVDPGDQ